MEKVDIYKKMMDLTDSNSKYSLYLSKNLDDYGKMIWPYVKNTSAAEILEYVECVPNALYKEAQKRIIDLGAIELFGRYVEEISLVDVDKFLKYLIQIKRYDYFEDILDKSLLYHPNFNKKYVQTIFASESMNNIELARIASRHTKIFGVYAKAIIESIFKSNDYHAIWECMLYLLFEKNNISINEIIVMLDKADRPFTKFIVSKFLDSYATGDRNLINEYIKYTIEPLKGSNELENICAKAYLSSKTALDSNLLEDMDKLLLKEENIYGFIDDVHTVDHDDKFTSELVKRHLLTYNQKLKDE